MSSSQEQEMALASELLEVTHEAEIDRFLPFLIGPALSGLKALAPVVMKAAGPLLKKVAVKALPKIKRVVVRAASAPGQRAACPQGEQEFENEFGFGGGVATRDARRWGTGFQRTRPRQIQVSMSRRFVRAAKVGARSAAVEIARLLSRRPQRPIAPSEVRRVVYRSLLRAVRIHAPFLLPTMGAVAVSLRKQPAYFGPALPRPRSGRLFGPPQQTPRRPKPTYFGPSLPSPRGRMLGSPPRTVVGGGMRGPAPRQGGMRQPAPHPVAARPPVLRPPVPRSAAARPPTPKMRPRTAGAPRGARVSAGQYRGA